MNKPLRGDCFLAIDSEPNILVGQEFPAAKLTVASIGQPSVIVLLSEDSRSCAGKWLYNNR